MAVYFRADVVTRAEITLSGGARAVTWDLDAKCGSLHRGEWLTGYKSQFRVERQRAVVVGRLKQPHSREAPLFYPFKSLLHELAPDRTILHCGIDRDWPKASYRRTLVEKVAADDYAVEFGDYGIKASVGKQASD